MPNYMGRDSQNALHKPVFKHRLGQITNVKKDLMLNQDITTYLRVNDQNKQTSKVSMVVEEETGR